jgi:hypothetical protein
MRLLTGCDAEPGRDVLIGVDTSLDKLQGMNLSREPSGPGKFEGNFNRRLAEALHDLTMESGQDDEAGDVTDAGMWAGYFRDLTEYDIKEEGQPVVAVIVQEDSNGFFTYAAYPDKERAERAWHVLSQTLNSWME